MNTSIVPSEELNLNNEIQSLQDRIQLQKARLAQHTSTLLSHTTGNTQIATSSSNDISPLITHQTSHNKQTLARLATTITTFPIPNPDPHAAPYTRTLLAIRFESFDTFTARYQNPHYVFLIRHEKDKPRFRVHRHTLPVCINVRELVERFLPTPKTMPGNDEDDVGMEKEKVKKQDLGAFVKGVRREITRFNWRVGIVKGLRRSVGLDGGENGTMLQRKEDVREISVIDAEVRQIRVEWEDARIGRIVLSAKGTVERVVVWGESGRDWALERRVLGNGSVEGLAERL